MLYLLHLSVKLIVHNCDRELKKKKCLTKICLQCKVERERDKDRLESKRRIDQLTKNMEVDQQENRKKTNEVGLNYLGQF